MKKIIILSAAALFASAAVFTAVKVTRSSEDLFIIENAEALADPESDGGIKIPCAPLSISRCTFEVIYADGGTGCITLDHMFNTSTSPVKK